MEVELEPRVKVLSYKVKGVSRESPSQKASHVLDSDLRSHWSSATNTKEWLLLELEEPCLLSHIRIYNKSVLEWEIAVGLRYKPETFVKVRPRCEAPRRDMIYPLNYTPCRYVRISCLRGNPIAIFFIQLIGVSVTGLEAEFQPVVSHILPHIISHKQDAHDMHLQLLQDITNRLLVFLPQLEADLASFLDDGEKNLRFLSMLVGPFYPILHTVNERETTRYSGSVSDSDAPKNSQPMSSFTVSSNFEPRRSRSSSPFVSATSSSMVFRPDTIFVLLRKAYNESDLGAVCRTAARILHKLIEPITVQEASNSAGEATPVTDDSSKYELTNPAPLVDYSSLFGEEFQILDDHWDTSILNVLDIGAVEEGILHVLYACASQPFLCHKLVENASDFWSALPLIQALLPALRPSVSSFGDHIDDNFSQWKQPLVQRALFQIVDTSSSALYRPLLHACAGYLSSFSQSHAKAACVLIDLCSSVLAPWMGQVIAKVDLTMELLEDLLGMIQGARYSLAHARAALKYIILALSGHMDDMLGKYKEVKQKILFLFELLEPFLDLSIYALKNKIAFGHVSYNFLEKQEQACIMAINIIRTAVQKPAVLPSLESEWRRGSVGPSVLLSILEPCMQLPPEIDLCKSPVSKNLELETSTVLSHSSFLRYGGASSKLNNQDEVDVKADVADTSAKTDILEDGNFLFAPPELRSTALTNVSGSPDKQIVDSNLGNTTDTELRHVVEKNFTYLFQNGLVLDAGFAAECLNLQADYMHLVNFRDCELRASEFRRLAFDLYSQTDITVEGQDAAIDSLLLAAECYVNPLFMMSSRSTLNMMSTMKSGNARNQKVSGIMEPRNTSKKDTCDLETVALIENERDKIVLQILLEAAELGRKFQRLSDGEDLPCYSGGADEELFKLSPEEVQSADAITLVRQNQFKLCSFLIQRLKKEQHSLHEILLHCLLFLLCSATQLYCAPEEVIDIILGSAEYLNGMLTSSYYQIREGNLQPDIEKIHALQRRWQLLQRLVIASSGGEGTDLAVNNSTRIRSGNLIPPSAWMERISKFSCSAFPLVRFIGWMAISCNAKKYMKERLFLVSDLSQLTYLLSIFADELAVVDVLINQKQQDEGVEPPGVKEDSLMCKKYELADQKHEDLSFHVIYPDLNKFFPNLRMQFKAFGENILEAIGLQLKSLSSSILPDILCWFSDLCSWPFFQHNQVISQSNPDLFKGYVSKNAKAIILYLLEAIVTAHMEAMVPEVPRVVQVLVSFCQATYCDVSFLNSIMCLLRPIISYSLRKVSEEEKTLVDDTCLSFETLCFEELFVAIGHKKENEDLSAEKDHSRALTIFILGCVFADLSFQHRRETLQSLLFWADFSAFKLTTSFHDYLYSFQTILESCNILLVQTLRSFGLVSDLGNTSAFDFGSEVNSCFPIDISPSLPKISQNLKNNNFDDISEKQKAYYLSAEEIEGFSTDLDNLITKLNPNVEHCWNLHHRLAKKLTVTSAYCIVHSRCLASIVPQIQKTEVDVEIPLPFKSVDQFPAHWKIGLEGLAEIISKLQEIHCWEVASLMLDCLFEFSKYVPLDNIIDAICSAIIIFSCNAPKIALRLQSDKWLTTLFSRGVHVLHGCDEPLANLFVTLLGHPEPEQRFIALQHLGRLVGQDVTQEAVVQSSTFNNKLLSPGLMSSPAEPFISLLVSSTWDRVALMASSDVLLPLRTYAMVVLLGFIPYAAQHQLQAFLAAADSVLLVLGEKAYPTCEGPFLRLSLALTASACLYSPAEDISLIPQEVWRKIEEIGLSKSVKRSDLEKNACKVLCRLRNEGDEAKKALKEVLSSTSSNQVDPDFGSTRESILQVLANLTSVEAYFDMFAKNLDQEAMELEEAEIELDILQKEHGMKEPSKDSKEERQIPLATATGKDENRLQQIKDQICTLYVLSSIFFPEVNLFI
uniref:DNA-repair protein Xrcc1 N-terminal domain-containing protein n=1 Tax=Rhizophora mucronata TaxID=61149 RepID=A0A2P2M4Z1_RHIMU